MMRNFRQQLKMLFDVDKDGKITKRDFIMLALGAALNSLGGHLF